MTEGFVGTGAMGKPIALNLLKHGTDLTVLVRDPSRFADLEAAGATVTAEPKTLADCHVVYLCLPDGAVVDDVLFGASGLAYILGTDSMIVDLTTHDAETAVGFEKRLATQRIAYVDAPISGMEARARDGTLTVMCGSSDAEFAALRPAFRRFASRVLHMGGTGTGQAGKLINQLLFNMNAAALAELLPVAALLGLRPECVADVINGGTGRSHASEFFLPRILDGRFDEGYPLEKAYKDMQVGTTLSAKRILPVPVLSAAMATYQSALLRGFGAQGKGAMTRVFEDLDGATFRRSEMGPCRVFSTLALQGVLSEMYPQGGSSHVSGPDFVFAPTQILQSRMDGGDLPDLALVTDAAAKALEASSAVLARIPLVISSIGLAMAPDATVPTLEDREALAAFLRTVPSVVYSASGASGIFFAGLLEEMGLEREVSGKATVIPSGLTAEHVANGQSACAIQQISELKMVSGVGQPVPFPHDAQCHAQFSAVVFRASPTVWAFLDALQSETQRLTDWGLSFVKSEADS